MMPQRRGAHGPLDFIVAVRKMKSLSRAEVAELADAHDSGSCARKGVGVRVPPSAPATYGPATPPSYLMRRSLRPTFGRLGRRRHGEPVRAGSFRVGLVLTSPWRGSLQNLGHATVVPVQARQYGVSSDRRSRHASEVGDAAALRRSRRAP